VLDATALPYSALSDLRELLETFPGESEVVIELRTSYGQRRLKLGNGFRVAQSAALHAELAALLGRALLSDDAASEEPESAVATAG
jgi:DNA polymerase-3 subunit alpha